MLNFAVTLQVIMTIACFVSVFIVAIRKPNSYSNTIIITFLCAFVQNGGYILELLSKSAAEGIVAVKAEYLGGAMEIGLITFFIFKYCGHELNKIIKYLLVFEGAFVLTGVWTWELNHMYYTGATYVNEGAIPHLEMGHNWLYFTFSGITVIELIACLFILTVSILKTNQQHMKYNYTVLLFIVIVPLLGFLISISGILGGYDAAPVCAAISVSIFSVALLRNHLFDVADAAGEKILADLDSGIIVVNNEGGYEYSNNKANTLFPTLNTYKRNGIINDIEIKKIVDLKKSGRISIGDRHYDVSVNDVKENKNTIGTTILLTDVTEADAQMEQMKELMNIAEEANASKSMFLTKVSHEVRTPINIVMGMTEILLRDHATDENKDYLNNIRNSSTTLLDLISDILDFSKMETGKLEIVNERFDLAELLAQLINIYDFRCTQKNIEFKFEIDERIPRYLIGDEIRVRQIATNLLSNAVKFTDKGFVMFKAGFKSRSDYDIDLILAVEDSGRGISKDEYDKLFLGFGRDGMRMSATDQGTGLGLNITKRLTEIMGGVLNFKSEVGKGTVFSVALPLVAVSDSSEEIGQIRNKNDDSSSYRPSFTAGDAKILIVDDSKISLNIMKELLNPLGVSVTSCTSGDECLTKVRDTHYDLIFMDHRMPFMDGVETYSRIKQSDNECHGVPVVMVTANATKDAKEYYISKGFTDFLLKPVNTKQLSDMLYKYLPEYLIVMNEENTKETLN